MVDAPRTDDDVVGCWQALGLPGLIDSHVHFMPERLLNAVWRYFDAAGPLTGREWPIRYRWNEQERLDHLRGMGVRGFPSLIYPHKPDMAASLNEWARGFAAEHDDVIRTATIFPEPTVTSYLDEALRSAVQVVKVHVQVGGFDPCDALLDDAWGMLADAQVAVLVHAGSGPAAGKFTGPEPIGEVLKRHPRLSMIVAHMGMPEQRHFVTFAEDYDNVRLDTAMCFTDFSGSGHVIDKYAARLEALQPKVLFGSDYPNIPHSYAHQVEALVRLDLGDEWLRDVFWNNAAALFGIAPPAQ